MTKDQEYLYRRSIFITSAIIDWMIDHNLGRRNATWSDFVVPSKRHLEIPGLLAVIRYSRGDMKYLFDKKHGGGSTHLLNDFDDEVLKPFKIHMERLGPTEVGLFQGRKLPRR